MGHKLFLSMYTFQIKPRYKSDKEKVKLNDFLESAYPELENKFVDGFIQDIVSMIDKVVIKNRDNTHGAILEEKAYNSNQRTFDITLDGGITGINQFIIDEKGNRTKSNKDAIIGPKFFGRFWLPSAGDLGYIFIQSYDSISIKRIFDTIMSNLLIEKNFSLVSNRIVKSTTKFRQELFMKSASLADITLVSNFSYHSTNGPSSEKVELKLKKVFLPNFKNKKQQAKKILQSYGIEIKNDNFLYSAKYEDKSQDYVEQKTTTLDATDDSINVIPNIVVPDHCIDKDNYPIFNQMKLFVDEEMNIVRKESKI